MLAYCADASAAKYSHGATTSRISFVFFSGLSPKPSLDEIRLGEIVITGMRTLEPRRTAGGPPWLALQHSGCSASGSQPANLREVSALSSAMIDRGRRMIISPVKPVVLKRRNAVEALALGRSRDCTSLEIPLAGSCGIDQQPRLGSGGNKRLGGGRSAGVYVGWHSSCDGDGGRRRSS